MIRSMTGFGAGQISREGVLVKVELRSVNHRFFDPQIRISRDFAGLESRVKELLGAGIGRGRVTANVDVQAEEPETALALDESMAGAYRGILRTLEEKFGFAKSPDPVAFAQLPEVVRRDPPRLPVETVEQAVTGAVEAALAELTGMRRREGEALRKDLVERIGRLGELLSSIEKTSRGAPDRFRKRLEERIGTLVPEGTNPDPDRLAMEVAILADKADIVEELVRFRAHNEAFLGFLDRKEPVGKRLDFLLQELNREANTLGVKSANAEIAHLVIEVKEEIERLREQVQNVE